MTAAFYQNETKFYVAVDCIILGFDQKELNVLLYKRKFEPMMGQWSLMGGFIKMCIRDRGKRKRLFRLHECRPAP